ncbi:MAG TPA: hypothetical protein VGN95_17600 [Pyrinomonadaceae bacterium]|nr:hypothetical protein [Pyrinomonadaceae bacterium]
MSFISFEQIIRQAAGQTCHTRLRAGNQATLLNKFRYLASRPKAVGATMLWQSGCKRQISHD